MRKENCLYQACPSKDCNKKVVDQQNGMYRCEKCDKEFPEFKYRLMLSVSQSLSLPLSQITTTVVTSLYQVLFGGGDLSQHCSNTDVVVAFWGVLCCYYWIRYLQIRYSAFESKWRVDTGRTITFSSTRGQ